MPGATQCYSGTQIWVYWNLVLCLKMFYDKKIVISFFNCIFVENSHIGNMSPIWLFSCSKHLQMMLDMHIIKVLNMYMCLGGSEIQ